MSQPQLKRRAPEMEEPLLEEVGQRQPGAGAAGRRFSFDLNQLMLRYGVIVGWLLMILVFTALRPRTFATFGNLQTIAGTQAVLLILTLGLIVPLAAKEFDLSVSGILGISLVLVGWLNVLHDWPIGLAIAAALGTGIAVGLVNAFFTVWVGVDSIIVTLGMGTLLTGTAIGINNRTTGGVSDVLVTAVRYRVLGLPLAFYIGTVLTFLVWYVFSYTPLGRSLYFVGAGREVARLSGIRVNALRVTAFIVSGFVSALAGVVLCGWLGASDPSIGSTFLLPAYAAAFLGASVIKPGRFNPWGTWIAVYFLVTGITGLQLLGISAWIEQVFYGASLIVAVALSRIAVRKTVV